MKILITILAISLLASCYFNYTHYDDQKIIQLIREAHQLTINSCIDQFLGDNRDEPDWYQKECYEKAIIKMGFDIPEY